MRAIEVSEHGDAGVLRAVERDRPDPGPGEVRVDVEAAGINFADVVKRRANYPGGPAAPYVPGIEVAGRVDAVGHGVDHAVGDRVMAMTGGGGYAEYALADADATFPVPGGTTFAEAAGVPVQFPTAHCCLFDRGGLDADDRVLVHAAAGGVGTAAVQLAARAGATVFGTASSERKLDLASDLGVDHPVDYEATDFRAEVERITGGEGVDLVLDGVGGEVFADSLAVLRQFGRAVVYGAASGTPGRVDTARVLFANHEVVGFHLGEALDYDPGRVLAAMPDLVEGLASGELEVVVGRRFDLADAADAHRHLENRDSVGKVVLEP